METATTAVGTSVPVEVTVSAVSGETRPVGAVGIVREIADLETVREKLSQERARASRLFENLQDPAPETRVRSGTEPIDGTDGRSGLRGGVRRRPPASRRRAAVERLRCRHRRRRRPGRAHRTGEPRAPGGQFRDPPADRRRGVRFRLPGDPTPRHRRRLASGGAPAPRARRRGRAGVGRRAGHSGTRAGRRHRRPGADTARPRERTRPVDHSSDRRGVRRHGRVRDAGRADAGGRHCPRRRPPGVTRRRRGRRAGADVRNHCRVATVLSPVAPRRRARPAGLRWRRATPRRPRRRGRTVGRRHRGSGLRHG